MASDKLVYGRRGGTDHNLFTFPVGASEVFKLAGGAFVIEDASGRVEIAAAGEVNIIGHAAVNADQTASATEGATKVVVDMSYDSVYEIPIASGTTAWADTMRGKTCDLRVDSDIQGVDLGASGEDVILLIDKGTTNAAGTVVSVLCKIAVKNVTYTGVV